MKTLFLSVAATALIFGAPTAFAQNDHHHGHPGGAPAHAAAPAHTTHAAAPSHTMHTTTRTTTRHTMVRTNESPATALRQQGYAEHGHTVHISHVSHNTNTRVHNSHTNNARDNNARGNHDHDNNAHGNNHAAADFHRHNVTASHHFHYRGGDYHGPSGYSYHRYSYGDSLPSIYFAQNYWIDDYSDYGLSYPPPGCVWVRYGDDAILIEQDNGAILEVVYGQFY